MGKPCFSKAVKFFAFALLGAAIAIAAIAVLSAPAAAHSHNDGGGDDGDDYPWDTDNLRYGRYNARSFNVPFHDYGGYSEGACQSGVADAFFQAGGSVGAVNDFPCLDWVADGADTGAGLSSKAAPATRAVTSSWLSRTRWQPRLSAMAGFSWISQGTFSD